MALRDWINSNPTAVAGGAIVILVAAVVWIVTQGMGGPGGATAEVQQAWYLDLGTGELFKDSADKLAPIESPNGNQAVRAILFSCGNCDNKNKRFVGYYEKVPPDIKKNYDSAEAAPRFQRVLVASARDGNQFHKPPLDDAQLQRLKDDANWVGQGGAAGAAGGPPSGPPAGGPAAEFRKIRQAPQQPGACSGGGEAKRCRPSSGSSDRAGGVGRTTRGPFVAGEAADAAAGAGLRRQESEPHAMCGRASRRSHR